MHIGLIAAVLISVVLALLANRSGITRSRSDNAIAGVCGGLAKAFNIPAAAVRILAVLFALCGFGLIAYIVFWIVLPER